MAEKTYNVHYNKKNGRWYVEDRDDPGVDVDANGHAKIRIRKKDGDVIRIRVWDGYLSDDLLTYITPYKCGDKQDKNPFEGDLTRAGAGKGTAYTLKVKDHILGKDEKVSVRVRIDTEPPDPDGVCDRTRSDTDIHVEC